MGRLIIVFFFFFFFTVMSTLVGQGEAIASDLDQVSPLGILLPIHKGENKEEQGRLRGGVLFHPIFHEHPYLVILGASMVDVGENAAAMPFRSNSEFPPYGLDYFGNPVARYSNGRLFIDFLSQDLGYGLVDPYLKSLDANFTHGVNFASSGATAKNGTVSGTGSESSGLFSFLLQVDQLRAFQSHVAMLHWKNKWMMHNFPTIQDLMNSVVFIEIAHNDYIKYAFSTPDFNPVTHVESTIKAMELGLKAIIDMGYGKIIVMNIIPLGCMPSKISKYFESPKDRYGCVIIWNDIADLHNRHLEDLLQKLGSENPLVKLILFDANSLYMDAHRNPSSFSVKYLVESCCGYYHNGTQIDCGKSGYVNGNPYTTSRCEEPSLYITWDSMHPTETFARHLADGILSGSYLKSQSM